LRTTEPLGTLAAARLIMAGRRWILSRVGPAGCDAVWSSTTP